MNSSCPFRILAVKLVFLSLYTRFHVHLPVPCDVTCVYFFLSFYMGWVVYKDWGEALNKTPRSVIGSRLFPFSRSVCPSHKICSCWLQGLSPLLVLPLHHTVGMTFCSITPTPIWIVPSECSGCCSRYFPAIHMDITALQSFKDCSNTVILDGSHFREISDRWLFTEGREFNSSASPHCDDVFPPQRRNGH